MEKKIKMGVEEDLEPVGIGGWLILVAIGHILAPVTSLLNIYNIDDLRISARMFDIEFPMMYFTVSKFGYICIFILSIILLYLFFQKKKLYVPFAIGEIIFRMVLVVVLMFIGSSVEMMRAQLVMIAIFGLTSGAIWILYYKRSVRVKNTFVEEIKLTSAS
ncbi:DUF2569 domain-containing protein [Acidaminobacter sp. JC074]|uniref:DUF2569 family protein n=1 Tax=Acidaminobacter sp. JC074 TaxID=2530199 RepID=UPI001F0F77E0|nr:DUF2569 family protein [Acidaminobacter sp. JC074]MCH4889638.1 DUF2569 domain-containing protein [Acidaminobacter sp. JC074]